MQPAWLTMAYRMNEGCSQHYLATKQPRKDTVEFYYSLEFCSTRIYPLYLAVEETYAFLHVTKWETISHIDTYSQKHKGYLYRRLRLGACGVCPGSQLPSHAHTGFPVPARAASWRRGRHFRAQVRERLDDEVAELEQRSDLILKFLHQ